MWNDPTPLLLARWALRFARDLPCPGPGAPHASSRGNLEEGHRRPRDSPGRSRLGWGSCLLLWLLHPRPEQAPPRSRTYLRVRISTKACGLWGWAGLGLWGPWTLAPHHHCLLFLRWSSEQRANGLRF